jgi:hypothetical protein
MSSGRLFVVLKVRHHLDRRILRGVVLAWIRELVHTTIGEWTVEA